MVKNIVKFSIDLVDSFEMLCYNDEKNGKKYSFCGIEECMDYISTIEKAKEWGISNRRVQVLAAAGRIEGAQKLGGVWLIPREAKKPTIEVKNKPQYYEKTSKNRNKLKSLLKNSCIFFNENISAEEIRITLISILNSNIINELTMNDYDLEPYYMANYVYKWMGGKKELNKELFWNIFNFFKDYVHLSNGDILNTISWSYQYLNDILTEENLIFSNTQFFTEQYMIEFLLRDFSDSYKGGNIFDPCCGGGNMLTAILSEAVDLLETGTVIEKIEAVLPQIIGYDIDSKLAYVSILNIRIKCLEILLKGGEEINFCTWERLTPKIYYPKEKTVLGMLSDDIKFVDCVTKEMKNINDLMGKMDIVITNPPFATVKGMGKELSSFLKKEYPFANCDICVSFVLRVKHFLRNEGQALMVVQNSWMFLDSFENFRKKILMDISFNKIMDLGSGAFLDLSGEKSSVALIVFKREGNNENINYYSLKNKNIKEKMNNIFEQSISTHLLDQKDIIKNEKSRFDVLNIGTMRDFYYSGKRVADYAVPMQGTSTGNNKDLVGYFWEHFNDNEWRLVSKGGGYSRWQGLNRYVVKWGKDGEYIKAQQGSALRNIKYFNSTDLVFSDTGTSGLNIRILLPDQIFIASGPGIRVNSGDKYALISILNSRLASYFVKMLSPKLTIAAGYIAKIPVNEELINSSYLSVQAQICINSKKLLLMNRPNNVEFSYEMMESLDKQIDNAISQMILNEIKLEVQKLAVEADIDNYIFKKAKISSMDIDYIWKEIGKPVYTYSVVDKISVEELDKTWAGATDASLTLSKNRVEKHMIGSDGIIEYLSYKFAANPKSIVEFIDNNINDFKLIRKKYMDLLFHNQVLLSLKYDVTTGVNIKKISVVKIGDLLARRFSVGEKKVMDWLMNEFNDIHYKIFYSKPFLALSKDSKSIEEVIVYED